VSYELLEHRHRFAVWAAARAAQRGFTTVANLRDALQATDIRRVLSDPETLQLSAFQFDQPTPQMVLVHLLTFDRTACPERNVRPRRQARRSLSEGQRHHG
jgi:hypothetical protein